MGYRGTGRARVSVSKPEAWAICDRCGFLYNHVDLTWQFDWQGPRTQNLRKLVCRPCYDQPFEHHRTIILPPDPVPIANPRPEFYTAEENPDSLPATNWDPLSIIPISTKALVSGNIGNMTMGAGVDGAFSGSNLKSILLPSSIAVQSGTIVPSKRARRCALKIPSLAGMNNYVGQNWTAFPGAPKTNPPGPVPQATTLALVGVMIQAPSDQPFLAGSSAITMEIDGHNGTSWIPLVVFGSVGAAGETLSVSLPSSGQGAYYGHRLVLNGDGTHAIAVATLAFVGLTEFAGSSNLPAVQPS